MREGASSGSGSESERESDRARARARAKTPLHPSCQMLVPSRVSVCVCVCVCVRVCNRLLVLGSYFEVVECGG